MPGPRDFLVSHRATATLVLAFTLVGLGQSVYLCIGGPVGGGMGVHASTRDEGNDVYDSARISRGEVMYRDFFEFQGPVFYHLQGAVMTVTGPSVTVVRALALIYRGITAVLMVVVLSRLWNRWVGVGAAMIYGFGLIPFYPSAYPHWLAETFVWVALALLSHPGSRARMLWAAGASLGLAALTILSLGVPVLLAALGAIVARGVADRRARPALADAGHVALGAFAVFAVAVLAFALAGAAGDFLYDSFVWPFSHYSEGQGDVTAYGMHMDKMLAHHQEVGWPGLMGQLVVWIVYLLPWCAPLSLAVGAAWMFRRVRRPADDLSAIPLAAISGAALAPLIARVTRTDMSHLAFVGSFGLCALLVSLVPLRRFARARRAVSIAFPAVGLVCALNFAWKVDRTWTRSRKLVDWEHQMRQIDHGDWLDRHLPADATMADGSHYSGLRYLYFRPAAVSHTMIAKQSLRGYFGEREWAQVARDVVENRPALLVLSRYQYSQLVRQEPAIATDYRRIKHAMYLRRDVVLEP